MTLVLKRAYENAEPEDGFRILVDRLWPRGISKKNATIDAWVKDVAPSDELRRWFGHDAQRWPEFQERYRAELSEKQEAIGKLLEFLGKEAVVTLVCAAKDEKRNNVVVLKQVLDEISHRSRRSWK